MNYRTIYTAGFGLAVILLCGCKEHTTCHRTPAAETCATRLMDHWAIQIEHRYPDHIRGHS